MSVPHPAVPPSLLRFPYCCLFHLCPLPPSVLPPDSAYSLFPGTPSFSGHLLFQTFLQFLLYLSFLTIPFLPVSLPFHPVRMPPPPAFHLFEAVPPLSAYCVHPPVLSPSVFLYFLQYFPPRSQNLPFFLFPAFLSRYVPDSSVPEYFPSHSSSYGSDKR